MDSIEFARIQDETRISRDGRTEYFKRADFYIGRLGPFTERVPVSDNAVNELRTRAELLRSTLVANGMLTT